MRYVFDNCLSPKLANMLAALDIDCVPLRAIMSESTPDIEIFKALRSGHDVLLTFDHKQKTRRAESRAIVESGVTVMWIGPFWRSKIIGLDQAKWIISHWDKISAYAESSVAGRCAEIKQNGRSMEVPLAG